MKLSHVATLILFFKMESKKNERTNKWMNKLARGVLYWLSHKITCNLNVDIIVVDVARKKRWTGREREKEQKVERKKTAWHTHNPNHNNNLLTLPIIIGLYIRICYCFKLQRAHLPIYDEMATIRDVKRVANWREKEKKMSNNKIRKNKIK